MSILDMIPKELIDKFANENYFLSSYNDEFIYINGCNSNIKIDLYNKIYFVSEESKFSVKFNALLNELLILLSLL